MAFACIYISDFAVQAAVRAVEGLNNHLPVAILDGPESLMRVFASNQAARRFGVEAGMTRMQAEALGPITLRKRETSLEESGQSALLDCGYAFSPKVESTRPGVVTVDLAGTESLWGPLQATGHELAKRCCASGFEADIGIAQNPDAASCAARGFQGITIIVPGEEACRLSDLPVEVLEPSQEIWAALDSWGIRTFRALASLPPLPLSQRLGQEGIRLQKLARGEAERNLVPAEPPPTFSETMELDEPVTMLEPLAFVLNRLLECVTSKLAARSLGTDHVELALELEIHRDRQTKVDSVGKTIVNHKWDLKLPVPTQDFRLLMKLLQLDLAAHPPQGPVKKVAVTAEPVRIRSTQAGLFQPLAPEPGKLEIVLARLSAVVGERDEVGRSRVGVPTVVDSHRPDNFSIEPFRTSVPTDTSKPRSSPHLALRLFRPAVTAKVQLLHSTPASIVFGGMKAAVMTCNGPWRSCGEWWELGSEWQRDEWDAVLKIEDGFGLYRLVHDLRSSQWFVEGIYD